MIQNKKNKYNQSKSGEKKEFVLKFKLFNGKRLKEQNKQENQNADCKVNLEILFCYGYKLIYFFIQHNYNNNVLPGYVFSKSAKSNAHKKKTIPAMKKQYKLQMFALVEKRMITLYEILLAFL